MNTTRKSVSLLSTAREKLFLLNKGSQPYMHSARGSGQVLKVKMYVAWQDSHLDSLHGLMGYL